MAEAGFDLTERRGYFRAAVAVPELRVADVAFNTASTIECIAKLGADQVQLAVFPELGLTGYTCADLFYQPLLLDAAREALESIASAAQESGMAVIVGLPLSVSGHLYNVAVVVDASGPIGIIPKTKLPTTGEFYEERWFSRPETLVVDSVEICGRTVPIGTDLLFPWADDSRCCLGVEICEDLWAVEPVSGKQAIAGATILANLSAGNELLGKADYRRDLVKQQSARCLAAYLYASAGVNESSTDLVFSGHSVIVENGSVLAETERFQSDSEWVVADLDVEFLVADRIQNSSFSSERANGPWRRIPFQAAAMPVGGLLRSHVRQPFVPADPLRRSENCREIFAIQTAGLATRLRHLGGTRPVLGVSGGLDSALALLVTLDALRVLGRPASDALAIVMPGPGSTEKSQSNAERVVRALGADCRVIPIGDAVAAHLASIGHPPDLHDITFENAQARERTQILMDVANQVRGMVVGTGDLSESALGWCTFNGDHMSMYHVNAGVPKTLVRHLVDWCAEEVFEGEASDLLMAIAATPITPELLPLSATSELVQKTEDTLGPYELHDFFLYHFVRRHARPSRIFRLALEVFEGIYSDEAIAQTMHVFFQRFFSSQFKRSSMPDGPKVGSVALSPRGDWRMPSDAAASLWLEECALCLAWVRSPVR